MLVTSKNVLKFEKIFANSLNVDESEDIPQIKKIMNLK